MRNAINKDFFREIKYTLNRYVSILLIVALGVAFLAGIRATCPDMKLTLDHYLDEADYMDLRVLSTLEKSVFLKIQSKNQHAPGTSSMEQYLCRKNHIRQYI